MISESCCSSRRRRGSPAEPAVEQVRHRNAPGGAGKGGRPSERPFKSPRLANSDGTAAAAGSCLLRSFPALWDGVDMVAPVSFAAAAHPPPLSGRWDSSSTREVPLR